MHGVHLKIRGWMGLGQGGSSCRRYHPREVIGLDGIAIRGEVGLGQSCWQSCVIIIVIIRQLSALLAVSSGRGLCRRHRHPQKVVCVAGIIISGLRRWVVPGVLRWWHAVDRQKGTNLALAVVCCGCSGCVQLGGGSIFALRSTLKVLAVFVLVVNSRGRGWGVVFVIDCGWCHYRCHLCHLFFKYNLFMS